MNDAQTLDAMTREIRELANAKPLVLQLAPFEAFSLLACLQLAWRHPGLSPAQKAIIETFGRTLETAFEGKPTLERVARDGWDRRKDTRR
jgi:hypothetical protein